MMITKNGIPESQSTVRRSSRIQVNSTKRKNEEAVSEKTQKRSKKGPKQDTYFSIFSKIGETRNSPSEELKVKPKVTKRRTVPRLTNDTLKTTGSKPRKSNLSTSNTIENKNVLQEDNVIDLLDDDAVMSEAKSAPEFVYVSLFMEQELPLSTLPNHIQQAEECSFITDNVLNAKLIEGLPDAALSYPEQQKMSALNSYFACSQRETFINNQEKTNAALTTEDYKIWTEKYKPSGLTVSGKALEMETLVNWLLSWKERLKPSKSKSEDSNSGSSYYASEDEDGLLKCMILTGCSGRGKTSAVHSIAEELGFKVFEVNPSASRVGRHILNQLQEATLSHRVEGISKLSPFFTQFTKLIPSSTEVSPKSSQEENSVSIRKVSKTAKVEKPKPGTITNFFKKAECTGENQTPPEPKLELPKSESMKPVKKTTLLSFFKPEIKTQVLDRDVKEVCSNDEVKLSDSCDSNKQRRAKLKQSKRSVKEVEIKDLSDSQNDEVELISDLNLNTDVSSGVPTMKRKDSSNSIKPNKEKESKLKSNSKKNAEIFDITDSDSGRAKSSEKTVSNLKTKITASSPVISAAQTTTNQEVVVEALHNSTSKSEMKDILESSKLKFSSLSLILFDDADINLEPDEGFWSAINSFLKVTRKPVILTTSQHFHQLCDYINSDYCVIDFDIVQELSALEYLRTINEGENLDLHDSELMLLLKHWNFDLRQCVLQLQFWKSLRKQHNLLPDDVSLPVSLLCLNRKISENIFKWFFDKELCLSAEILYFLHLDHLNLIHENIGLWLPFNKVVRKKVVVSGVKPVKKTKTLDISWLSDEGSNSENEDNATELLPSSTCASDTTQPDNQRHVQTSLLHLFRLHSDLSDADVIHKVDYECGSSFWQPERRMSSANPYSSKTATELSSWLTMLASRHCNNELHNLPVENIDIFTSELNINERSLTASKLFGCQEKVTNNILMAQKLNHRTRCLDYYPMIRTVCRSEAQRKENNQKRSHRFLHYFKASGLNVDLKDLVSVCNVFSEK